MPDKPSILRRLSDDVSWFVDLSLPRLKLRQYGPDSHCKELAEAFPMSDQLGVLGRMINSQGLGMAKTNPVPSLYFECPRGVFYGVATTRRRNFG